MVETGREALIADIEVPLGIRNQCMTTKLECPNKERHFEKYTEALMGYEKMTRDICPSAAWIITFTSAQLKSMVVPS